MEPFPSFRCIYLCMKLTGEIASGYVHLAELPQSSGELILRARQGDGAAWEELVQQYQQPAFRLAYLFLHDSAEAEDVAQETFIRAFQALDRFDLSRPMLPWILGIAANLARNRRRSTWRFFAAIQRLGRDETRLASSDAHEHEQQWQTQALWHAVQRLRQNDREVIYLRFFLDMSVEETAQTMNTAPGTVKSRLNRALKRLREVIDRDHPDLKDDWI
jgi:RNA polymerase sigma-70 factor, ECF subfamily